MTPKKILAIETSGKTCSAALCETVGDNFTVRAEIFFDIGLRHSEILKGACAFLLDQCKWKMEDLNLLAVDTGPGSFTGIRVGVSFMRAFAQARGIPLIGIPAFEILAAGIPKSLNAPVEILIDSIGREIFTGRFNAGHIKPLQPYKLETVDDFIKKFSSSKKAAIIGPGFQKYKEEITKKLGRNLVSLENEFHQPHARRLAQIAHTKTLKTMPAPTAWQKVLPFYLRPPIAHERAQYRKKR